MVTFVDDDLTIPGNEVPNLILLVETRDRFGLLSTANMTNQLRGQIEKRQPFLPLVAQLLPMDKNQGVHLGEGEPARWESEDH